MKPNFLFQKKKTSKSILIYEYNSAACTTILYLISRILSRRVVSDNGCFAGPMTNPFTVTSPTLWCCTAAGARNYATPPPVLSAITGSASLSSQVLRLTWHRPALRYDHNNVHEIIHRGGFRFGCHQGNGWAFCLEAQPAGSVLGILWCRKEGRRLVVHTHPGASKRGDDRTWRRADISFKQSYRSCPSFCSMHYV